MLNAKQSNIDDIVFVSNYSYSLNNTLKYISENLSKDIKYKIVTYKKSSIKNSVSYEDFISNNYDLINNYSEKELQNKYKNVNFMKAIVAERHISNYYFGIEGTLGNKYLSYSDMMFFIKSYVLFLEQYIPNSRIIFSGYADNFISTLTYLLSDEFNKKCLTFHPHWVVDNETTYINDGIGCRPYSSYITKEDNLEKDKKDHLKKYDNKLHFKEYSKRKSDVKKGIFGIISPNIFDINRLKFILFGYITKDRRINKFLNINKPSIYKKILANVNRIYNKLVLLGIKRFIEIKNIEDSAKFFYFPLQIQPEASTSSRAPYFMNQLEVIFNISKSLPLGYVLVIKEHPMGYGMRSIFFYKRIKSLNNVLLISSDFTGKELIKRAELTIGFGGTTLFESIVFGKKYFLLTYDYIYTESTLIRSLKNISNIFNEIQSFLDYNVSDAKKKEEEDKMLQFFYKRGFPLYEDFEQNIAIGLERILHKELK